MANAIGTPGERVTNHSPGSRTCAFDGCGFRECRGVKPLCPNLHFLAVRRNKSAYWAVCTLDRLQIKFYNLSMAKIVCHAQKQKTLTSMPHHIDRIGVYDADGNVATIPDPQNPEKQIPKHSKILYPERRKWNRGGGASYSDFEKEWNKEIEKLERIPQNNASPTVCFNNSAGEEFWVKLREKYPKDEDYYAKCEEYFKDCRDMLDELYPDAKTLKWATHYEELRPHQHAIKACILKRRKRLNTKNKPRLQDPIKASKEEIAEYKEKLKGWEEKVYKEWEKTGTVLKFSSGEFLGGRDGLELLQDKAFEKLGGKWGLERGDKGSAARHTDQAGWQVELINKDKELKQKENKLKKQEEENIRKENIVEKKANYLKNLGNSINEIKKSLSGEERIGLSVITVLNEENVRGEERVKFYKLFFTEIPNFVKGLIKRIREVPEQINKQETNTQTIEKIKKESR